MSFLKELEKGLVKRVIESEARLKIVKKGLDMVKDINGNPTEVVEARKWYNLCKLICSRDSGFGIIHDEYKTAKNYMNVLKDIYKF